MNKGFTMIEVSIAIGVMMIGVVGIYSLVPRVAKTVSLNTDKFVAVQLAREGMEIIRNIRDSNWLEQNFASTTPWDDNLDNCSNGCEIGYNDSAPVVYQDRYLKIDTNGFYNYETGQKSKFKRKITITSEGNIMDIKVDIFRSGSQPFFTLQGKFYDWR